jgi:hypothetical protein
MKDEIWTLESSGFSKEHAWEQLRLAIGKSQHLYPHIIHGIRRSKFLRLEPPIIHRWHPNIQWDEQVPDLQAPRHKWKEVWEFEFCITFT